MTLLKKYWFVVLALAVLIFFLWRGCKAGPDHSEDKNSIDSLNRAYTLERAVLIARADSLSREDSSKKVEIDQLIAEKLNMQRDLATKGKAIDQTILAGSQARIAHDTVKIIASCDSLTAEVIAAKDQVRDYEVLTDSLSAQQSEQLQVKDALISTWHNAFLHADTAVTFEQAKYNSLYTDYVKVNRKLKFSGIMEKGSAVVITALVIGLLIKK